MRSIAFRKDGLTPNVNWGNEVGIYKKYVNKGGTTKDELLSSFDFRTKAAF